MSQPQIGSRGDPPRLEVDDIVVGNHNRTGMNSESKSARSVPSARSNYGAPDQYEEEYDDQGDEMQDSRPIKPKQQMAYNDFDPEVDGGVVDNEPQESFAEGEHPLDGVPGFVELPVPEELVSKARLVRKFVYKYKE